MCPCTREHDDGEVDMKDQNRNASRRLFELPSWEFIVLVFLLLTVIGVALRSPVKTFPSVASAAHDPYDLQTDHVASDSRNRVVTGF